MDSSIFYEQGSNNEQSTRANSYQNTNNVEAVKKVKLGDALFLITGLRFAKRSVSFSAVDIHFIHHKQLSLSIKMAIFTSLMSMCFTLLLGASLYFSSKADMLALIWSVSLACSSALMLVVLKYQNKAYLKSRLTLKMYLFPLLFLGVINGVLWGAYPLVSAALMGTSNYIGEIILGGVMLISITWGFPFVLLPLCLLTFEIICYSVTYYYYFSTLGDPVFIYVMLAFVFLYLFLAAALMRGGFYFVAWTRSQLKLNHEKHIISLVLKDFEETTSDWLWQTNEKGCIDYSSANFLSILGLRNIKSGVVRLLDIFDNQRLEVKQLNSYISNMKDFIGLVIPFEYNGSVKWLKFTGKAVFDDNKCFMGYRGVGSDITARRNFKIAEDEKQRFVAISEMSGGLSHDFNNLLSGILLRLELIKKSKQLDCENKGYIDESINTCHEAARITRQLLAASRKETIEPENISILDTLKKIKINVEKAHPNIALSIHCDQSLYAWADKVLFKNALDNITNNAVRAVSGASATKGESIEFEVSLKTVTNENVDDFSGLDIGEFICISIKDSGGGFSEDELAHAFEPFYTRHRDQGGSGLGLSMVKGFALQSSGEVVISNNANGAVVALWLPAGFKMDALPAEKKLEFIDSSHNFLIVEDYVSLGNVIAGHMRANNVRFSVANTVKQALHFLERDPSIDFIIADIILPDGRGSDIVKAAREKDPEMPIIYISGFVDKEIEDTELKAPFIRKPFRINQLINAINAHSRY